MLSTLATIWLVHLIATATPGANTLLIVQLAASQRRSVAVLAAIGVAAGSAGWATLAAFGLDAVFDAFPNIRLALQILGGIYLVWIAKRIWASGDTGKISGVAECAPARAFRLGLLTNFSNPKAALFFGSVFATSFPPDPPWWLLATSVAVVFANSLLWYGFIAHLFSRDAVRSLYIDGSGFIAKLAGAIMGGVGASLVYRSFAETTTHA